MDWQSYVQSALHIPADWLIIAVFAIFASFDALRSGPSKEIALAIALPISLLLYKSVAATILLSTIAKQFTSPFGQMLLFGVILIVLTVLFHRMTYSWSGGTSKPLQALIVGIALAVIAVSIWIQFPPFTALWHFGSTVTAVFGAAYALWWLLAAYVALSFVRS